MPTLDWSKFDALAGSRSQNFENLCRGLMRLHFGSFGDFRALRNQPGVEFHLKLSRQCPSLGDPPRWWGWQCKLYDLTDAGNLRASARTDIVESLRKTEKYLPKLTDWALWTPYTLSKTDQIWFNELETEMEMHLWAEEEIDTYLAGPGIILRSTYFGDLIASPDELERRHRESVQPIKERWFPIHQQTEAERILRRMLGEPGSWRHLIDVGERLRMASERILEYAASADAVSDAVVEKFVHTCEAFADMLLQFHGALADGDLDIIQQQLSERQTLLDDTVKATPRHLRKLAVPISLDATNALHDMRNAQHLLDEVYDFLGVGLVAVLADAGGGKTQLSAAITAPQTARPSGVLLHGRRLHRGDNLNDLAREYSLNGKYLDGFEQLLAALDSVAKRSSCRLPIVIDGLNEAENPKDWMPLLASLRETVKAYPNVLVVCTLRTGERGREQEIWDTRPSTNARESFSVRALPEGIRRIESEGFGADTEDAIKKYFEYFKIDTGDAEIPFEFLQHPLTLRIFCQVVNPLRNATVKVDYFPAALAPLFEKYVEHSATRVAELPNLSHSYTPEEVHAAIYELGIMLWEQHSREIKEKQFRDTVGDTARDWDSSIVNLLAQEGLIFRNPGEAPHQYVITPTFDALGGFLIANSLLTKNAHDNSFAWLSEPNVVDLFGGDQSHELASDIFRSLVALTPRRLVGVQFWKVAPDVFKDAALRFTTSLDPDFLDEETIKALRQLFDENPKDRARLYSRLNATRAAPQHPLNAEFLDKVLRPITPVGERDLSWTEWIRATRRERLGDVLALELRWKSNLTDRGDSDRLRLMWLMWHLTSSDRELRDITTRALYWFGRGDPEVLFDETIKSLEINDPYIPERMLAASYGVAMAHRANFERADFTSHELPKFARQLFDSIFAEEALHMTTHMLIREYAVRIVELACLHETALFSGEELARTTSPFSMSDLSQWGMMEEPKNGRGIGYDPSPFRMDFENYTLGRLVPDRGNYDYDHVGYRELKARILWRIDQMGWFDGRFVEIDNRIAGDQNWSRSSNDSKKTDRYGKKYSWIAYFEMAGLLHDLELIDRTYERERTSDVDIDPSFPEPVLKLKLFDCGLLGSPDMDMADWLANGDQPEMVPYLIVPRIGVHEGPWVALDGFVIQEDEKLGRRSFCFVRSFIVENALAENFRQKLADQALGGRWLPEMPSVIYTFAGEIPWCATYPINGQTEFSFIDDECTVKDLKSRTEFEALIPVCDFGWEGYQTSASDAGQAVTLAKEIACDLNLVNRPQEFDHFVRDGSRATLNISDHSEEVNNRQSFFFIREDLLKHYLERCDSTLIWAIWGEREYSSKQVQALFHSRNRPDPTHGDIRIVLGYNG